MGNHNRSVHLGRLLASFLFTVALAFACSSDRGMNGEGTSAGVTASGGDGSTTGGGDGGGTADDGSKFDVGNGGTQGSGDPDGDGCVGEPPVSDATLTGTVFAPNLQIPISGALVYTASTEPEGIPDGVYCAQCQAVQCHHHHVFSSADGTFELPAVSGNGQFLVVIKGEFMHVTQIDIAPGVTMLAPEISSLPGEWNPTEGHYIPRMAVMRTANDQIYNVLAKIGLAQVDANGDMVDGTEQFDVFGDIFDNTDGQYLLDNLSEMNKYHIIFVPCMSQDPLSPLGFADGTVPPLRIDNIRKWVESGGKWYVTDWANEYLYDPFPVYQTFHQPAAPDLDYYDSDATVLDPDLLAWLQALPPALKDIGGGLPTLNMLPTITLLDNWSGLDQTPPVVVQDMDGNDIDVGHYPWVEGPCEACTGTQVRPMTVTARYGCGRMLFSTYHTNEASHVGLTPQELVLLYIILEIGVCDENPPPPIPPQG